MSDLSEGKSWPHEAELNNIAMTNKILADLCYSELELVYMFCSAKILLSVCFVSPGRLDDDNISTQRVQRKANRKIDHRHCQQSQGGSADSAPGLLCYHCY